MGGCKLFPMICSFICPCVGAQACVWGGQCLMCFFSHSPTLFFETQSLIEPGVPIQLGCLTKKSQEPSCLCLPSADLKGIAHHSALLRTWAPALLLRWALSWLNHSLQHPSLFFKLVVRLVIIPFSTFLVGSFMVRTGFMWTQCVLNPSGVAPLPNLFSPRHARTWLPDRSLKVKELAQQLPGLCLISGLVQPSDGLAWQSSLCLEFPASCSSLAGYSHV